MIYRFNRQQFNTLLCQELKLMQKFLFYLQKYQKMGHSFSSAIRSVGSKTGLIKQLTAPSNRSALANTFNLAKSDVNVQSIVQSSCLGKSCEAGTGLLGYSLATTVLVGGFTVIAVLGTGFNLYTRNKKGSDKVEQVQSKIELSQQELQALQWKHIQMKEQLFNQLVAMTQPTFIKRVESFICPYLEQVMRKPCVMKCCKDIASKLNRMAEKVILQSEIKKFSRCILCLKQADYSFIELDEDLEDRIVGFRYRIWKTYLSLHSSQKQKWGKLIDSYFGRNYTQKYLKEPVII